MSETRDRAAATTITRDDLDPRTDGDRDRGAATRTAPSPTDDGAGAAAGVVTAATFAALGAPGRRRAAEIDRWLAARR